MNSPTADKLFSVGMIAVAAILAGGLILGFSSGFFDRARERQRAHEIILACIENKIPSSDCQYGEVTWDQ